MFGPIRKQVLYLVLEIKPLNNQSGFPLFVPRIFLSFSHSKRKQTWSKTGFRPMKSLFSFSTDKTDKNEWKNWGKQDWWFDITNKILGFCLF